MHCLCLRQATGADKMVLCGGAYLPVTEEGEASRLLDSCLAGRATQPLKEGVLAGMALSRAALKGCGLALGEAEMGAAAACCCC